MKKKICILVGILLILTGCKTVHNMSIDEIIEYTSSSNLNIANEYRTGYKYYRPGGVGVGTQNNYNENLVRQDYEMYFYVDVISYYNKVVKKYEVNDNAYYSKEINNGDKFGYIEINKYNNDYFLLEIMYNYAKIEVIIDEDRINDVVSYAMIVLSSIKYNDEIINNLMGENVLDYKEIDFDIFKTNKDDNILEVN